MRHRNKDLELAQPKRIIFQKQQTLIFNRSQHCGCRVRRNQGKRDLLAVTVIDSIKNLLNAESRLLYTQKYKNNLLKPKSNQTMCSCFRSKLLCENASKKAQERDHSSPSLSVSAQLRDVVVRVVHAGGRIEMYETALPAAKLIRRYPGMCIATPDVFRRPNDAVLSADDVLLPGNKYFVVRCTTVEKLRRRQSRKGGAAADEAVSEASGDELTDKDFTVAKNGWSILKKHMKEKKKFVPPIQRPRIWKESDWEPSLTSIKELSI